MPYYGDNSDLKQAGRNIALAEIIFPVLVILINVAFLCISIFVLEYTIPDIFNVGQDDHLLLLSGVILIYATIDLFLGFFLCVGVTKLSPTICRTWIFFQLICLAIFLCLLFLFPFFSLNLDYIFWELICCSALLVLYKCYRTYVMVFLIIEIRQEGIIWKQQSIYE